MKKLIFIISLSFIITSCGTDSSSGSGTDGLNSSDHRIFVTSTTTNGNLGGLTGADEFCQGVAEDAGLKRTYKAVLGDSSTAASSSNRLEFTGSIYMVDASDSDILIASTGTDLWATESSSQDLLAAIDLDESGNSVTSTPWTGSNSEGSVYTNGHCSDWSSTSGAGVIGSNAAQDGTWLEYDPNGPCGNSYPLYCISQ